MTEWVAWIEPTDRWGFPYEPPRRYIKRIVPSFQLTASRGAAARYPSEELAERSAKMAARDGTPFGAEAVRSPGLRPSDTPASESDA